MTTVEDRRDGDGSPGPAGEPPRGGSRPTPGGADRDARLKAALRSNIARRKARAHALRQAENPPHHPGGGPATPEEDR